MPAGALDGEAYRAARRDALSAAVLPEGEKPLNTEGRAVCISSAPAARLHAAALCPGAAPILRTELDEPLPAPAVLPGAALPLPVRAFLDRPRGAARREAAAQAEALIASLEREGRDCVLFSHPARIPLLLDRLRVRGYCFSRSGLGAVRPGERILATRREAHCGGCAHNCVLTNPGCGVGRDRAARAGIRFTTGGEHETDKG